MRRIDLEAKALAEIKKRGYDEAARFVCSCGVVAVLCTQKLPKNPTYTLFFNIYRRGSQDA